MQAQPPKLEKRTGVEPVSRGLQPRAVPSGSRFIELVGAVTVAVTRWSA